MIIGKGTMKMKNLIIDQILDLKEAAIRAGFDFPSQDPQEATIEELESFLQELNYFFKSEE